MATERVDLSIGVEQTFQLTFNDIVYRFDLRYDDYNNRWWVDIFNNETNIPVIQGLYLLIGTNAFRFLSYLKLSSGLGLYDTDPENPNPVTKADLGNRIKMFREVD